MITIGCACCQFSGYLVRMFNAVLRRCPAVDLPPFSVWYGYICRFSIYIVALKTDICARYFLAREIGLCKLYICKCISHYDLIDSSVCRNDKFDCFRICVTCRRANLNISVCLSCFQGTLKLLRLICGCPRNRLPVYGSRNPFVIHLFVQCTLCPRYFLTIRPIRLAEPYFCLLIEYDQIISRILIINREAIL